MNYKSIRRGRISSKVFFAPGVFFLASIIFVTSITNVYAAKSPCTLSLGEKSLSATVIPGGEVHYTLAIKNNGQRPCNDVRLSMYYSDNEIYAVASPFPVTPTNYYWYIDTLPAGKTTQVNITTKAAVGNLSAIENSACVSAVSAKDSCATMTVSVSQSPTVPVSPTPSPIPMTPPVPEIVTTTPSQPAPISSKEYGVWVWDSPYQMSLTKGKQVVDQAQANGFKAIYITIDDYLTINEMPEGSQKSQMKSAYTVSVDQFITYAHQKGIAVDSVAGWRDWAKPEMRFKPYAIMDYVLSYNSTHSSSGFRNIQYDVEPYILPDYETNKAAVLLDFVDMVNQLVVRNTSSAGVTVVIPHFYDALQNWTPQIAYKGKTAAAFTHLLNALDAKPNNSLTLMSYRDHAAGADGTVSISKPEIDEASLSTHRTKVIIAQETGNVDPSYVTFYGKTRADLMSQIDIINNAFVNSSAFGGISVHYLDPFLQLK